MNALPTRRRLPWRPASLVAAFSVWMMSGINPVPLAAIEAPAAGWRSDSLKVTDSWNTLTLDISVRRRHVKSDGTPAGIPSPAVSYRLARSKKSGSWKTVLTVLSMDRFSIYSLKGLAGAPAPLSVVRIEDDEDGTPVRAYDSLGRQLALPTISSSSRSMLASLGASAASDSASPSNRLTAGVQSLRGVAEARQNDRGWIDNFLATAANKKVRLRAFERGFGAATTVNGLSRFSKTTGLRVEEVLVSPRAMVPVENNVVEDATMVSHRTFAYRTAYADTLVRSAVHSEHLVTPSTGERAIDDTTFTNISLSQR
jgi:hypothetical protein